MHATLVDSDKKLVWTEVPEPVVKAGDILVETHAAALNRADLMQRDGNYPPPPGWPEWMGLEVAGIVLEAPADSRWKPGDKVCALLGGGGHAERVAVPTGMALPIPEGLSMAEAAAIPEVFATAYLDLCIEGNLKAGEMAQIDMDDFFKRGVKLIGSTRRSRSIEMKTSILAEPEEKPWPSFSEGKIKVFIHKTLPISEAEAAHAILKNNENLGKVVLAVKD